MPEVDGTPDVPDNDGTENVSATVIDLDESKTNLINANGGAGDHDNYKTAIIDPGAASSDGEGSFNGLGKDEVMQYANDPFWVRLRWVLFILFWLGWIAMLVTAVAIIVLAPRCPPRPDLKWYNTDRVYQVFPKSYKDSDKDGVGDFGGLKDKADYVEDTLGINSMWLTAMFKTDGSDASGLAVVDHKDVEEYFGTKVSDLRSWMKKMLKDGKRVILDFIPNQTGKDHPWFKKSQAKEKGFEDFYIWAPNNGQAPNNWKRMDNTTSAWTLDTTRNEYYYSQFGDNLPDLNLRSAAVVKELEDIMKFWFDAGVSGFNIRDVEYLLETEDLTVADNAAREQTVNHPDTLPLLEKFRKIADSFSDKPGRERVLFATVYSANHNQTMNYWGTKKNKRLHIVSPILKDLDQSCDATCIKSMVESTISDEERQWVGLQLGNEHMSRITSRMDITKDGLFQKRLMVAHALQLLLPGTAFNYYGDEFGQRDSNAVTSGDLSKNFRGPLQWNKQENAGFTEAGVTPWNNISLTYKEDNVEAGLAHFADMTPLKSFQELSYLRTNASFQWGKTKLCAVTPDLLLFSRKAHRFPFYVTLINLSGKDLNVSPLDFTCVPSKEEGVVSYHSREEKVGSTIDIGDTGISLQGHDIIVLQFEADE